MGASLFNRLDFNISAAGWTRSAIAAGLAAFMSLSAAGDAQAQSSRPHPEAPPSSVPTFNAGDGLYNLAPDSGQQRMLEQKAHDGENLLADHFQFIDVMKKAGPYGQSCCHMQDGVIPVEVEETDNPSYPYRVKINQTRSGLRLSEPVYIDVPASVVLTPEHAIARCAPYVEAAEANGVDHTCTPPPFAVLWFRDGSEYYPSTGKHSLPFRGDSYGRSQGYVDSDYIVPAETYQKPSFNQIYCFWPEPSAF